MVRISSSLLGPSPRCRHVSVAAFVTVACFHMTVSAALALQRATIATASSIRGAAPSNSAFTLSLTRFRRRAAANGPLSRLFASDGGGGRSSAAVTDPNLASKTTGKSSQKNKKLDTNPPKGTRDFYPDDMLLRNYLFEKFRQAANSHGFREYDAPVLESEDLYVRKAGEDVSAQLYGFEDKGGRRVSLRPEMTPSLARMVMAGGKGIVMPLKWFSIPQCWRYERMTRGRRREHYQWNVDIWGIAGVEAEAELLATMVGLFESLGITAEDVGIRINSRGVIKEVLAGFDVPEEKFAATCVLVDKLDKMPIDAIQGDMEALGLARSVVENLTSVLTDASLDSMSSVLGPDSEALTDLRRLFALAEAYGITEWLAFDASVVRGLAYYTGTVFEAFDRKGELRAIAGGGRYDRLLETFGGESTPACGFGFGDAVIVELMKERGVLPSVEGQSVVDVVVFALNDELYGGAVKAAREIRKQGMSVDVVLEKKKMKWAFKHADRLGAKHVVVVAPDEWERGEVSIKDLTKGEQILVKVEKLEEWCHTVKGV
uniref:histidine--tRNA ligase n=1 Tax=Corethron hystrix TaxID=216773 RepID=A0A7S1BJC2_9STRA|mmetsp:Transcript_29441/g.67710  ORF Transcript_29441/g.67710 Transcript_29441/m.67710 type:complete len:545 (+) Transcript_29441:207-1841(+)